MSNIIVIILTLILHHFGSFNFDDDVIFRTSHCACGCQEGRTALHYAAVGGHTEAVRLLITAGCDIDARDKVGICCHPYQPFLQ